VPPSIPDLIPALERALRSPSGRRWYVRADEGERAVELVESGRLQRRMLRERRRRCAWIDGVGRGAVFGKRVLLVDPDAILRATWRLRGRLLGNKGALLEAQRTLLAEGRLRRVARLLALGERRRAGWVVEQTLLFEALLDHETLLDRLAATRGGLEHQRSALERAMRLALELDTQGLVHLDLNPKNVMLHASDPDQDCVVDIEQLVELEGPRPDLLAHTLGHLFSRGAEEHCPRARYHALALPALARGLGVEEPPDDVLAAYDWFLGRSLGRRVRLKLARVGLAGMPALLRAIQRRAAVAPRPTPE